MTPEPWFSEQISIMLGPLLGGGYGGLLLGGIGGGLCGPLASKGIAKNFVLTYWILMAATGAALLIAGIVAVLSDQPYRIWYPFVLTGAMGLGLGVMCVMLFTRQYRIADQRKLEAQELRSGSVSNSM